MAKPPRFTNEEVFALLSQMAAKGEHISAYRLKQLYGGRQERYEALIEEWGNRPVSPELAAVVAESATFRVVLDVLRRKFPIIAPEVLMETAQAVADALKAKETS